MSIISLLRSAFGLTCPHCRKDKMFFTSSFSFKRSFDMKERCSHCNQKFELEVGFFYGAMMVGYVLSSFCCLSVFAIFRFLVGFSLIPSMLLMVGISAITFVYQFRIARSIWCHLFIRFDESAGKGVTN